MHGIFIKAQDINPKIDSNGNAINSYLQSFSVQEKTENPYIHLTNQGKIIYHLVEKNKMGHYYVRLCKFIKKSN